MNNIKSLQASLLNKTFQYQQNNFFVVSTLWGFYLDTGEAILEQNLWTVIGESLGGSCLFDEGMNKDASEFIVYGDAFAPRQLPVPRVDVSISVAEISKTLSIYGERYWQGAVPLSYVSKTEPFTQQPLSYDFAYGGADHLYNKEGKGLSNKEPVQVLQFLANIEQPKSPVMAKNLSQNSQAYIPQGFSSLPLEWPQRKSLIGTYDDDYLQNHMPGLAEDINWDYFFTAPDDQRFDRYLKGDEPFSITNMHETMTEIKGNLPRVIGRCFIEQEILLSELEQTELDLYVEAGSEKLDDKLVTFKEIPLNLDTVYFFPNENIGVVMHRGSVEVSHPQAKDIKKVLLAHQGLQETPKTKAYYQEQMRLRADPDEGFKYMMYTAPLLPEGVTCGFKQMLGDADYEQAMADNMTTFAERKKTEAETEIDKATKEQLAQLKAQGLDKEAKELEAKLTQKPADVELPEDAKKLQTLMDKILPGITTMKESPKITDLDLTQLNLKAMDDVKDHMEAMAEKEKVKALASVEEQIIKLKKQAQLANTQNSAEQAKQFQQSIERLEAMLASVNDIPVLTRPDFTESNKQMVEQINQAKTQLLEQKKLMAEHDIKLTPEQQQQMAEVETQLSEKVLGQVEEAQTFVKDSYLQGAHFIPAASSPHKGKEAELVAVLLAAYLAGTKISQKDLAFCQFSQQKFSGIDIANSFFEYSQLTQIQFKQSNLTAINFAHAALTDVTFENCEIKGANLGAAQLKNCQFIGLNLNEITLAKSTLSHCEFIDCDFGERMDMLLETQFHHCLFTRCKLIKLNFIELELTGCQFNQCDLSESNFIKPVFNDACFKGSDLSKVNFVMANMSNNNFEQVIMNNTRFVGGCDLKNSCFNHAEITETNLRDCQLQGADFSHAIMYRCDFGDSVLTNSNFNKAIAKQCQFLDTRLTGSTLKGADLMEASFMQADIRDCNFSDANLYSASFLNATLGGTSFYGAILENTLLKDWRPS